MNHGGGLDDVDMEKVKTPDSKSYPICPKTDGFYGLSVKSWLAPVRRKRSALIRTVEAHHP